MADIVETGQLSDGCTYTLTYDDKKMKLTRVTANNQTSRTVRVNIFSPVTYNAVVNPYSTLDYNVPQAMNIAYTIAQVEKYGAMVDYKTGISWSVSLGL